MPGASIGFAGNEITGVIAAQPKESQPGQEADEKKDFAQPHCKEADAPVRGCSEKRNILVICSCFCDGPVQPLPPAPCQTERECQVPEMRCYQWLGLAEPTPLLIVE